MGCICTKELSGEDLKNHATKFEQGLKALQDFVADRDSKVKLQLTKKPRENTGHGSKVVHQTAEVGLRVPRLTQKIHIADNRIRHKRAPRGLNQNVCIADDKIKLGRAPKLNKNIHIVNDEFRRRKPQKLKHNIHLADNRLGHEGALWLKNRIAITGGKVRNQRAPSLTRNIRIADDRGRNQRAFRLRENIHVADLLRTTTQRWPQWLSMFAPDAIKGLMPRPVTSYGELVKIGEGTYGTVYRARDPVNGNLLALKEVKLKIINRESVKHMAKEILVLRYLDHPSVIKLEGIATSEMPFTLFLVFEYMEHDLGRLVSSGYKFTELEVKCYMKQLLLGLEYCHEQGVLHRDIKSSNILLDSQGVLKIADFGLSSFFDHQQRHPMTNNVVTLWYRPPELLLGATFYDFGVDLWSAGCILCELLVGKPIMQGQSEVDQLTKIFRLCGSPPEEYWKNSKLPNARNLKQARTYKGHIKETFREFPLFLPLIETLLAIDPKDRGTATSALQNQLIFRERDDEDSIKLLKQCKAAATKDGDVVIIGN